MSIDEFRSGKSKEKKSKAIIHVVDEGFKSQKTFLTRFDDDPTDPRSKISQQKAAEEEALRKAKNRGLLSKFFSSESTSKGLSAVTPIVPGGESKKEVGGVVAENEDKEKAKEKKEKAEDPAKSMHAAKYIVLKKLSSQSKEMLDHPSYMRSRVLLPNEQVLGEFECFMDVNKWPISSHLKLLVCTCGLYIVYLIWRVIMVVMYALRLSDRGTHKLNRHVMQITDQGRLIIMGISMHHKRQGRNTLCFFPRLMCPDLLDTPIDYDTLSQCTVYSLSDVKELSLTFESDGDKQDGDYSAKLKISLRKYGNDTPLNGDLGISTMSSQSYVYKARQLLGNGRVSTRTDYTLDQDDYDMANINALNFDDGANNNIDNDGITSSMNLTIGVDNSDSYYGENMKKAVNDITNLYTYIASILPATSPALVPPRDNVYNSVSDTDNSQNYQLNQNAKPAYNPKYSNITCNIRKFYLTTRCNNITILSSKNLNIEVPETWVNMADNEQICGTYGEYVSELDGSYYDAIVNGLTFGQYLQGKSNKRVAYILTDRRLITVCINAKNGFVPLSNRNCSVDVRSLYFGTIKSGYISSDDPNGCLETGIWTSCGFICLRFLDSKNALSFVRLLHQSTSRIPKCPYENSIRSMYSQKDGFEKAKVSERLKLYKERPVLTTRINNIDIVPVMEDDPMIDVFNGHINYESFGMSTFLINTMNRFILLVNWILDRDYYPKATHVCSKRHCGICFPVCPKIASCGAYPYQSLSEVLVFEGTVFHINRAAGVGPTFERGRRFSIINRPASVKLIWMPTTASLGSVYKFNVVGRENFIRKAIFVCGFKKCCPDIYALRNSTYECRLLFGDFYYSLSGISDYYHYDFRKDQEVLYIIGTFNVLQLIADLHHKRTTKILREADRIALEIAIKEDVDKYVLSDNDDDEDDEGEENRRFIDLLDDDKV